MPSTAVINRIFCKRADDIYIKEADAAGTLKPGHILQKNAAGTVQVQGSANSTPATGKILMVAVENDIFGKSVDDAYASGDRVMYGIPKVGDELYVRVAAGAGAIAAGDLLATAADGTAVKTVTAANAVFRAVAALDNSAGVTEAFVRAESLY